MSANFFEMLMISFRNVWKIVRYVYLFIVAGWPSGLRRWFQVPVTSVAGVPISLLSIFLYLYQNSYETKSL